MPRTPRNQDRVEHLESDSMSRALEVAVIMLTVLVGTMKDSVVSKFRGLQKNVDHRAGNLKRDADSQLNLSNEEISRMRLR